MPKPKTSPPDSVLALHQVNLASLSAELGGLQRLFDMWWALDQELATAEAGVEGTVEEILAGQADDQALGAKSVRVASLGAQIKAVRKKATVSGTAMQLRLQKDVVSVERLVAHWLDHRLETETAKLLETLPPQKREILRDAATEFARAGIAYVQSETSLPPAVSGGYGWQRPIEPPASEKSALSVSLIADPLYRPSDPRETLSNLLEAARALEKRWHTLLEAVASEPQFELPTYEPPIAEAETIPVPIDTGRPAIGGWTAADLLQVPFDEKYLSEKDREELQRRRESAA